MFTRKRRQPKYMLVYQCLECNQETSYTELDIPMCRFCRKTTHMNMISKQELSLKIIADRLRKSSDNNPSLR